MIIGQDHSQRNVTFGLREIAQCHLCELITLHKKIYSCGNWVESWSAGWADAKQCLDGIGHVLSVPSLGIKGHGVVSCLGHP